MTESYRRKLDRAVEDALAGATLVTANTRASRHLLRECDRRRRTASAAWQTPAILPLGAWIGKLWQAAQASGALDSIVLSPLQQQALWTRIVDSSSTSPLVADRKNFAHLAALAWDVCHGYRVPLRAEEFRGAAEAARFFEWASAYRDLTAENKWTDSSRQIDCLLPRLSAIENMLPERIVLAGFDQLTPQQHELTETLASRGIAVTVLHADPLHADLSCPDAWAVAGQAMQRVRMADRRTELTMAAGWARAHLAANPAHHLGVVVTGLSEIRNPVEQVFSEILHPEQCFTTAVTSARAFDVSLGRPLADYPIIRPVLTLLRLLAGQVNPAEFSSWLRSPYFGAVGERAGARAQLDLHLRAAIGQPVTLDSALAALHQATSKGFAVADLIARVQPLRDFSAGARQLSPGRWIAAISKFLSTARWPGERDGLVLSSEEYQARESWEELLTEIASLELIRPLMELREIVECIVESASAKIFKPRNQLAPVQVMGELEAAGSSFDALWIAGWCDEAWPARSAPNPLIPIALQRACGLPHSSAAQDLAFARNVTARLLQSAPQVTVSWPAMEEDRALRPSPLIAALPIVESENVPAAFPKRGAELFPAVALEAVQDYRAPAVTAGELRSHGTRIVERQSNCPFRAFVELRLFAVQENQSAFGLAATDRGKLVEAAIQSAWETLREKCTLDAIGDARLQEIVQCAVDAAFQGLEREPANSWEVRYFELERQRLAVLVREWLDFEKRRADFRSVAHQRPFDLELAGLRFHGRIDRIDQLPDGSLVVVDYKTGQQSCSAAQWKTPRPVLPQLPLYAVALLHQSPTPKIAAVAFALVNRGNCGMNGVSDRPEIFGKSKLQGAQVQESLAQWEPELESIVKGFLGGDARIAPKYPPSSPHSTCRDTHCHLSAVCRMAEIEFPAEDSMEALDDECK